MNTRAIGREVRVMPIRPRLVRLAAMSLIGVATVLSAAITGSVSAAAAGLPNPTVGSLGFSDAIAGDMAIVGAPGVNNGAGAVDMYKLSNGKWVKQTEFTDPRSTSLDEYGWSVAITNTSAGTYAAVGASAGNGNYNIVYVYTLFKGKWYQEAALLDPLTSNSDNFGSAVAISATTLVVGSPCFKNEMGRVYIYEHSIQGWLPQASETNPANIPKDWFGQSLSISGTNVLVGAVDAAYAYAEAPRHHWQRSTTFRNPGSRKDNFGWDVALSGNTAIVGAPGGVPNMIVTSPLSAGAAYIYALNNGKWSIRSELRPPSGTVGDQFGYSVAIAGGQMLIGMPLSGATRCGKAFEYKLRGTEWFKHFTFSFPGCKPQSELGFAVGVSQGSVVYGVPYCNDLKGDVYFREVT